MGSLPCTLLGCDGKFNTGVHKVTAESNPTSKEITAFISSTYIDLKPHREKVEEALARIETNFRSMKFFGSKEGEPLEQALHQLRQCNYYIGIIGHRYGVVHETSGLSYTELEYEEAKKLGISRRIYLADAMIQINPDHIEPDALRKQLEALRQKLRRENTLVRFSSPEDLATKVVSDIALEKDRKLRSQNAADSPTGSQKPKQDSDSTLAAAAASQMDTKPAAKSTRFRWMAVAGATTLAVALILGGWLSFFRRAHALGKTNTVVIADFANSTGDPVFDDALKQGLTVGLAQSPYLSVLSDQKVRETLKLMGRSPDEHLTPDVARDLCQRAGSEAFLSGSIASLGRQYVIGLSAVNCQTGDLLAEEQVTADGKEQVLRELGVAATELRGKVGESLSSIQKFDTPLDQATTPSLDALKAYSLGKKAYVENGSAAAVSFFKEAVKRDPNFAMAYAHLGICYWNLYASDLASENLQQAYELRDRVSERERLTISALYHRYATGDMDQANQANALWAQTYPRDPMPHASLGAMYGDSGQYEKALAESLEAVRLTPGPDAIRYGNVMRCYVSLNRLNEAKTTYERLLPFKLENPDLHLGRYQVAFLEGDVAEMERHLAWAAGKPGTEDLFLFMQAGTEAYFGRLEKARELYRHAIESAQRSGEKETAAAYEIFLTSTEVEYGNSQQAHQEVATALSLAPTRDVKAWGATVLARAGDSAEAEKIADELAKQFPLNTMVTSLSIPTIGAAVEINRNNPPRAIEYLQAVSPYELGWEDVMYSAYLRGLAYLQLGRGNQAAAEFQRIVDHHYVVLNNPQGALAYLGIARACVLQGDTAKARAAYQDFFSLWKDADTDIPILKEAKAEYAKLQ